jgi:hypothetical protein
MSTNANCDASAAQATFARSRSYGADVTCYGTSYVNGNRNLISWRNDRGSAAKTALAHISPASVFTRDIILLPIHHIIAKTNFLA